MDYNFYLIGATVDRPPLINFGYLITKFSVAGIVPAFSVM